MWPWRVKMPTQNLIRLLLDDVDAEDHVGNSLLQIWKLTFGPKLNFCSDFDHKGWPRFWSWSSGKILKLEFVQHFAADVW